jgi:sulfoxide reductase catalytic subunit YedY
MHIRRKHGWEIAEREVTPEAVWLNRRSLLGGAAGILAGAAPATAQRVGDDPTVAAYPFPRNPKYKTDREITPESLSANYNNFIEFGSGKRTQRAAQALVLRPWVIKIDGETEKPREVDIDTLFQAMQKEERVYRFRCVEGWSTVVPWTGFPLKDLIAFARPLSAAKYVRFETFTDPKMAPGQKSRLYPWPYREAITMEEATHPLSLMATGAYGKPMAKQFGAPLRLVVPWKYGFKSIKSVNRITFTRERPVSLWEELQPDEYGFWANINPDVPHKRWSQADEEALGTGSRIPTKLYNGYAAEVADLYRDIKGERLFT